MDHDLQETLQAAMSRQSSGRSIIASLRDNQKTIRSCKKTKAELGLRDNEKNLEMQMCQDLRKNPEKRANPPLHVEWVASIACDSKRTRTRTWNEIRLYSG